jgi:hypothetical protein
MSRVKVLETILVLILALGVVYWWFGRNPYILLAAGIIGVIGLFIPVLAVKIHRAWMKLAEGIGYVMSKVILTIVFVVFLLPVAFLARLFRKGNGSVQMKHNSKTYFKERNFTYTKESLENVW